MKKKKSNIEKYEFLGSKNENTYTEKQCVSDKKIFDKLNHSEKLKFLKKKLENNFEQSNRWFPTWYYPIKGISPLKYTPMNILGEENRGAMLNWMKEKTFSIEPQPRPSDEYWEGLNWFRGYHKQRLNSDVEEKYSVPLKQIQSKLGSLKNSELKMIELKKYYEKYSTDNDIVKDFEELRFQGEEPMKHKSGRTDYVYRSNQQLTCNDNDDLVKKYIEFHSTKKIIEFLDKEKNKLDKRNITKRKRKYSKKKSQNKITNNSFDYSNLDKYFHSTKIESFKEIENELTKRNFFTDGKWCKTKKLAVTLIYVLQKLDYLKPQLHKKNKRTTLLVYRRLFENRYKINSLSEEMQPSNFDIGKLKTYKAEFFFIPEIGSL